MQPILILCNQRSKNQPKTSDKNQPVEAKSKQLHPWAVRKKMPRITAFAWIWICYRLLLSDISTSVQPDRLWCWKFCKCCRCYKKIKRMCCGSATNYLWFCVSPQDENFQGKSARPLFSINSFHYDVIVFLKKEKEGNTKKKIEEYPLWKINSFTKPFAGFYGDESGEKNSADFGWKVKRWLQILAMLLLTIRHCSNFISNWNKMIQHTSYSDLVKRKSQCFCNRVIW